VTIALRALAAGLGAALALAAIGAGLALLNTLIS